MQFPPEHAEVASLVDPFHFLRETSLIVDGYKIIAVRAVVVWGLRFLIIPLGPTFLEKAGQLLVGKVFALCTELVVGTLLARP